MSMIEDLINRNFGKLARLSSRPYRKRQLYKKWEKGFHRKAKADFTRYRKSALFSFDGEITGTGNSNANR